MGRPCRYIFMWGHDYEPMAECVLLYLRRESIHKVTLNLNRSLKSSQITIIIIINLLIYCIISILWLHQMSTNWNIIMQENSNICSSLFYWKKTKNIFARWLLVCYCLWCARGLLLHYWFGLQSSILVRIDVVKRLHFWYWRLPEIFWLTTLRLM